MEKQNMNLLNMKAVLRNIKRNMRPHTKFDEMQVDNCVYQFEGKLQNGVTFDGRHSLPEEGIAENAFIYLHKNGKELGVITTENGFVKQAPNHFWHGRNIGGVQYVDKHTAISYYSPNWDVKDGLAYKVSEKDEKGKAINQFNVYFAPEESVQEALNHLLDAVYPEKTAASTKLRHFKLFGGKSKDNGREM